MGRKKKRKARRGRGRPVGTGWHPKKSDINRACKRIIKGQTIETVSRPELGAAFSTVYKYMRDHPSSELNTAIQEAIDISNGEDEVTLKRMGEKGDFRALRMRLINRNKEAWKDRVELTGEDGGPIETSNRTTLSVKEFLQAVRKGAAKRS